MKVLNDDIMPCRGVNFFPGQGGMKAVIYRHSRTFQWLCPISFQNVKFGLLGGMTLRHSPRSIQIESGPHTYTGVHIIVLAFAVTVSIYYSAVDVIL